MSDQNMIRMFLEMWVTLNQQQPETFELLKIFIKMVELSDDCI
jgi:hypothetical protein